MRLRTPLVLSLTALVIACKAGPTPRDASNPGDVPIYNTAAVVENPAVTVPEVVDSPASLAVLAQPDRDPRDRALDARYQGADLLTFLRIQPGMRVADLATGGGYMAELFARGVGPTGLVIANEPPSLVTAPMSTALTERLARPANRSLARTDRELSSPLPEVQGLDVVYLSLPHRSAEAFGVDTSAMNRTAFDALKPGGRYVVLDYRPRMNAPTRTNLHALHREESTNVQLEVEAAGFQFVREGRFLRNDPNPNDWNAVLAPNPTALEEQDRFLLEFVKR
jgi:predicted methyltransferase